MDERGQRSKSPVEFYYEQQREQGTKAEQAQKPYFVVVDGVQVFTADFVHEQMAAQSRRISRAITAADSAVVIAALSVIILVIYSIGI